MENIIIYLSRKKISIELIPFLILIAFGIYLIYEKSYGAGYLVMTFSIIGGVNYYFKSLKNQRKLAEFNSKGIITEEETIKWKYIKSLHLEESGEKDGLCIIVTYSNQEILSDYFEQKKDLAKNNYYFDKEKFNAKQLSDRMRDLELGYKSTYFEEFDSKEEADKIFELNEGEELKAEAEIDYDTKSIPVGRSDLTKEQIQELMFRLSDKVNNKLP